MVQFLNGRVFGGYLRSFAFQAEALSAPQANLFPLESRSHHLRLHLKVNGNGVRGKRRPALRADKSDTRRMRAARPHCPEVRIADTRECLTNKWPASWESAKLQARRIAGA
jgi:hypothetical protein